MVTVAAGKTIVAEPLITAIPNESLTYPLTVTHPVKFTKFTKCTGRGPVVNPETLWEVLTPCRYCNLHKAFQRLTGPSMTAMTI